MNLKSLFLIVSCVAFSNIHCSYQDQQASKASLSPSNSDQTRTKVTEYLTPPQTGNSQPPQSAQPTQPAPSNLMTTLWYGAARHVGKQTALGIFKELNQKGTLKADFETNRTEAFNRLNAAAAERFTQKDLLASNQQAKIADLFITATAIDSEFALAKALAAQYYIRQKEALENTLKMQANQIEPQLREKRNSIILQAEQDYIADLNKELAHGKNAASNSRYLHKRAEEKQAFIYQNESHYKDIESFSKLLHEINSDVEIANDTNLYHLPKTAHATK